VKLTNDIRNCLIDDAKREAFKTELDAAQKKAHELFKDAYEKYVPAEQRALMQKVDPQFLQLTTEVRPRIVNPKLGDYVDLGNPNRYRNQLSLDSPVALDNHYFSVSSVELYKAVKKHNEHWEQLVTQRSDLVKTLRNLVDGCRTSEQLLSLWPKKVPLPPGWKERLEASPVKASLPAVVVPAATIKRAFQQEAA
jgi:hypothetical protein